MANRCNPARLLLVFNLLLFALPGGVFRDSLRADDQWAATGAKLVQKYCSDCHGEDVQEGEVNLSPFATSKSVHAEETLWKEVLRRVEFGAMPPEDAEQLSKEERTKLIQSIESALFGASCDLEPRPGKVTVRRLNRAEYNNTIRDLFGITLTPADAFPSDEVGAGFDNNGDVLTLPPMLMEKYLVAAEQVAARVVIDPKSLDELDVKWEGDAVKIKGEHKTNRFDQHDVKPESSVVAEFELPYDAHYNLNVQASSRLKDERVVLEALIDDKPIGEMSFRYRSGEGDTDHEWLGFRLPAGKHRIRIRMKDGESKQHSEFRFRGLRIDGPQNVPDSEVSGCHWELVRTRPSKERSVLEAASENLKKFLPRAFRSPVSDEDVRRYAQLAAIASEREETFERSMQVAITGALVSPRFLFRNELPRNPGKSGESYALNSHQLANRLSYFLWSSMPDKELTQAAAADALRDDGALRAQVKRMLFDAKATSLADNFAAQWLGLRNITEIQPDEKQFRGFSEELRSDMVEETRRTFLDCVLKGQTVLNLLDQESSFLNERLANHYGVKNVTGDEFRRVSLKGTGRAGIMTQASVLMLTSNPTRTSPVKRGKWVMENILGTPPPDPPPGIPELEETASANPDAPMREQLAIHRDNAMCASCHRQMDAIGFGFENFDAIGKWREKTGKHIIDPSGKLPDGGKFSGAAGLAKLLRAKHGRKFVTELTKRLMTFALGRELNLQDRCAIIDIVDSTEKQGWKFLDLTTEVVLSEPFRRQVFE